MILFDQIVEIFALPQFTRSGNGPDGDVSELRMQEPTWCLLDTAARAFLCQAIETMTFKASSR
jgi:hypothetical protein